MSCMTQVVAVKRVHPNAKLPVYATAGAAAADVCTVSDTTVVINPGSSVVVDTGLQFEVPIGYELKVHSRSGTALSLVFALQTAQAFWIPTIAVILWLSCTTTRTQPLLFNQANVFVKCKLVKLLNTISLKLTT